MKYRIDHLMKKEKKEKPFLVSGSKIGKQPQRYFSYPHYTTDGVYMDQNRRNLMLENENNKRTIHSKPFRVINTRKTELVFRNI